jgi:hypothetical protein
VRPLNPRRAPLNCCCVRLSAGARGLYCPCGCRLQRGVCRSAFWGVMGDGRGRGRPLEAPFRPTSSSLLRGAGRRREAVPLNGQRITRWARAVLQPLLRRERVVIVWDVCPCAARSLFLCLFCAVLISVCLLGLQFALCYAVFARIICFCALIVSHVVREMSLAMAHSKGGVFICRTIVLPGSNFGAVGVTESGADVWPPFWPPYGSIIYISSR